MDSTEEHLKTILDMAMDNKGQINIYFKEFSNMEIKNREY
jgi:hypothetical protein